MTFTRIGNIYSPRHELFTEFSDLSKEELRTLYEDRISEIRSGQFFCEFLDPEHNGTHLVVFDLDGTLVSKEYMIEVAFKFDPPNDQLLRLTHNATGNIPDWENNFRKRVALLKGFSVEVADKLFRSQYSDYGAKELMGTLKRKGIATAIITGAYETYAQSIAKRFGIDYAFGTEFEKKDGRFTGEVVGDVLSPEMKTSRMLSLCEELGISPLQVTVIGDGYNDIEMMLHAGQTIIYKSIPNAEHDLSDVRKLIKKGK